MDDPKTAQPPPNTLCPNFKQCSKGVWRNFKTCSKKVWINHYCNGPKKTDCVRRVLKLHGQATPESLLPNGESLIRGKILSLKLADKPE